MYAKRYAPNVRTVKNANGKKKQKTFDMWWITESVHYFFSGLKTFWLLLTVWLV